MLSRRTGAEVAVHNQNARAFVPGIPKGVNLPALFKLLPIVFERVRLEPLERDGFQKARGNDPVRVYIVSSKRNTAAGDVVDNA